MRDTRYEIRDTKIRAVLFDLGDTLLNFGRVDITGLFRRGARLSYDFLQSIGRPVGNFRPYCWRNLIAIRLRYWLSNITGRDFDVMALLKKTNAKKGIRLNEQQWRQLEWLWYEPLSKEAEVEPNITETLSALQKLGLKLGILSNTFITAGSLERHLAQFGILDFFSARLYSYEFAFRKPDLRIFDAAAQKIGETPQNIMFVGDRIDNDIAPALEAGMTAVLKTAHTNISKTIPNGTLKINRLNELPAIIEKINNTEKSPCTI